MNKGQQQQIPQNCSKTRLNSESQAKRNFFDSKHEHNILSISAINNSNNDISYSGINNNTLSLEKLSHHPSGQASQITSKHLESFLNKRKPNHIEEQQNVPMSHQKRNEELKNEFVFSQQSSMNKDLNMQSKQSDYTNILAAIAFQNQARETKLKQLNEMLERQNYHNNNNSSVFSIDNSQSFISDMKSGQSQLGLFNPIMLAQRILRIQEEIKNVHCQIEIQEEKIEEHTHMITEIKKSSLHKTEEIHDLTSLTQQYSQQAKGMEKKVLSMERKISTSNFQQKQASRVIGRESEGNIQRLEEYRQSAEGLALDVTEELKMFNKIEDRKYKLEKKLSQTRVTIESLLFEQKKIISKQENQCSLIKEMNAFNVLSRMFVYQNPQDIENVEIAFEQAAEKLEENDKASDQLYFSSSGRSKAMIVKEEIMKFEELHQNNVELIVGKLAMLFQELTRAHDTMSMRCEDLLLQKKRLLSITNKLTVEDENNTDESNTQVKQVSQMMMGNLNRHGLIKNMSNSEEQQENVKISLRDTINIQQLAEETFLFVARILSKLVQLLSTFKILIDKVCNSSNDDKDKQAEILGQNGSVSCKNIGDNGSKAQIDLKMAVQERSVEETPDNSMEIERQLHKQQYQTCSRLISESSKGLFKALEEVQSFLSTSRSQMLRELQSDKNNNGNSQMKEYMDFDEDQSKISILEDILESKMNLGVDQQKEFFEFIKNDFIINNFCSLKDFECFFTDLSTQTPKSNNKTDNEGNTTIKISNLHRNGQEKEKETVNNSNNLEMILGRSGELRQAGRVNYEQIVDQHVSYILQIITLATDLGSIVKTKLDKQKEDAILVSDTLNNNIKSRAQSISEQRQEIMLRKISQMDQKKGKGRDQLIGQKIDIKKHGRTDNSKDNQNRSITDKDRSQIDQGDLIKEESIVSSPTFYREDQVPEEDVHEKSRDQNEEDDSVDDESDQNEQRSIDVIVQEKQTIEGQMKNDSFQEITQTPRKSNNYMNTNKREVRISQEARQMWKKIKSFQDNTHSFQPLPPISASEIRNDFESQRATLHLHHLKNKPTPIVIQSARTEKDSSFSELKLLILQKQQQIAKSSAKKINESQEDQQLQQNCSTSMLGQYSPAFKTARKGGSMMDFSKIQSSFTTTQTHLSPLKSTVSRSNSQSYLHSSQRPSPLLSKRNSGEQLTQKDISHRRVKSNTLETTGINSNKLINSQLLVPLTAKETQKPYSLIPTKSIFQNEPKQLICKNIEKTNSQGNLSKQAAKGFVIPPVNQDSLSRRALKEEMWGKSSASERIILQREMIMNAYLPHKISSNHKRGQTFAEISQSSFIKTSRHLSTSQTDLEDAIPPYDGNRLRKIYNI